MAEGTVAGGPPVTTGGSPGTSDAAPANHAPNETDRPLPEAVAALPDVPGAVSTRSDVLAARAEVLAARQALAGDVDELEASARRTFDIKARIRSIPERVREDPARAAAAAAVVVGAVAGVAALIVRSRRRKPYGYLPSDIEEALSKLGKNRDKLRKSLEDSFAEYLREHGAAQPSRRRGLPPVVGALAVPVATQVARQAIKRMMAPPEAPGSATADDGGGDRWWRDRSKR